MKRVLLTGAAGDVGGRLRKLLKPIYPDLRLSDIKKPADLGADEAFVAADLAKMDEVEKICDGVEGIVHLGGFSVEGPWETILQSNIIGCYNLFEAARRKGVKRVVFASSNHAVGFYPRTAKIGVDVTVRPDSRYGISKAFGEALGAFYSDKHDLRVLCLRIGNVGDKPLDQRRLSIWLKPEDLVQLIRIGFENPGSALRDFLRRLLQRARVVGQQPRLRLRLPADRQGRGLPRGGAGRAGQGGARSGRRLLPGRHLLQRRVRRRHFARLEAALSHSPGRRLAEVGVQSRAPPISRQSRCCGPAICSPGSVARNLPAFCRVHRRMAPCLWPSASAPHARRRPTISPRHRTR